MRKLTVTKNVTLITRDAEYDKAMGMIVFTKQQKHKIAAGTVIRVEKCIDCLNNYLEGKNVSILDLPSFIVSILDENDNELDIYDSIPYIFTDHRDIDMRKFAESIEKGEFDTYVI